MSSPLPPHLLVPELPGAVALDAAAPGGWGASLLAVEPEEIFSGGLEALESSREWLRQWEGLPDAAVLVGRFSYDLGRSFEKIPDRIEPTAVDSLPPVWFAGFRAFYLQGEVRGSDSAAVRRLTERLQSLHARPQCRTPPLLRAPRYQTSDEDFCRSVRAVKDYIRAGDAYQVNLARRLDFAISPEQVPRLYAELTAQSPAPFSAYLDTGDSVIVSNSPESFLRVRGRAVETRPIKGTRPRGRTPEEDRWLGKELVSSAKDRAEHLMIVDLERNDLGRVCETGSVSVPHLLGLESYSNVHHLVSRVRGTLRSTWDWHSLLAATFPGGSITGAPKVRAMEIIEELEPVRRGVYTGAIGVFWSDGAIDLSIAIRTAVARGEQLSLYLGGGIVADSNPEAELAETADKGSAFARFWSAAP